MYLLPSNCSRALKCYQKAVQLQPDHIEALSCCGDLLFASGREVYSCTHVRFKLNVRVHLYAKLVSGFEPF